MLHYLNFITYIKNLIYKLNKYKYKILDINTYRKNIRKLIKKTNDIMKNASDKMYNLHMYDLLNK